MKKYFLPLFVMALLAVGFSSCKPDEEIYNPTCKISKIWYLSDVGEPNEVYIYDEKTKDLDKIIVDSVYSFDFTYEKDHSIKQIVHVGKNYTEQIDFQTTDRLVDKMTYTIDGEVRLEYTFHRNENKKDKAYQRIESIDVMYDVAFYEQYFDDISNKIKRHPLYDKIIGDYEQIAKIVAARQTKDLVMYSVKRFTYDPGKHKKYENLSQYVEEFPREKTTITHTYQYDLNAYNPFYGLPFAYADIAGYYKNLKVAEHIEEVVAGTTPKVTDITYDYSGMHYMNDKGYPRQFVTRSTETNNIPRYTYILYKK